MDNHSLPVSLDKKVAFVLYALEAAEKRRSSAENKASILLASNAILLTAISSLGSSLFTINSLSFEVVLKLALTTALLSGILLSTFWSIITLTPVWGKRRQELLNIKSKEFNLFFSVEIAKHKDASAYTDALATLSEYEIFKQLTTQTYNLSRIVKIRYERFQQAHYTFLLSVLLFVILTVLKIFD